MPISNDRNMRVGFATASPYTTWTNALVMREEDSALNVRLAWSTYAGLDCQESFEVRMRYRGYIKGYNACTDWSNIKVTTIPAASCSPQEVGGYFYWSYDMSNIRSELVGSSWQYRSRIYDMIYMEITIIAHHTQSYKELTGQETTNFAGCAATIEYIPQYRITNVYYNASDELTVEYSTTWTRRDDRFSVKTFNVTSGGRTVDALANKSYWGTIYGPGKLYIPTSVLSQHIKDSNIYLEIYFNASYRVSGTAYRIASYGGVSTDRTICNTPWITASIQDGSVLVKTGDTGDLGAPIEKITVKLVNGRYGVDQRTVAPGQTAIFDYCPFDVQLDFIAVGSRYDAVSKPATCSAGIIQGIGNGVYIQSLADGSSVYLMLYPSSDDFGPSITSQGDYEMVDLARGRPSAFYGQGGNTHISLTAACPEEFAGTATGGDYDPRLLDLEAMPQKGDVMLRLGDGRRYAIAAKVDITQPLRNYRVVTISGDEVSA